MLYPTLRHADGAIYLSSYPTGSPNPVGYRVVICFHQRLVRAVLCTGITVPAVEDVSSSILKAVLRGDADALLEACARKRRKGVDVALTADSRLAHQFAG